MTTIAGKRAVILGGTGAIGGATALRLAQRGWQVDVTGRDPLAMPEELRRLGVRFHACERQRSAAIAEIIGSGADLLVDVLAYRAQDIRQLLPALAGVGSTVVISGRAVYCDPRGRHVNSDEPPQFTAAINEHNDRVAPLPDGEDPFTAEGYGSGKVAVENVCRESGLPITVLRPSKVHGRWARQPRTARLIETLLTGEALRFSGGGAVNHLSAADDIAALIEIAAVRPGRRSLNVADRSPVTARQLVFAVAERLGRAEQVTEVDDEPALFDATPWHTMQPFVLDTSAAESIGHRPRPTLDQIIAEIDWVTADR